MYEWKKGNDFKLIDVPGLKRKSKISDLTPLAIWWLSGQVGNT
jgi:hypothetical protein